MRRVRQGCKQGGLSPPQFLGKNKGLEGRSILLTKRDTPLRLTPTESPNSKTCLHPCKGEGGSKEQRGKRREGRREGRGRGVEREEWGDGGRRIERKGGGGSERGRRREKRNRRGGRRGGRR